MNLPTIIIAVVVVAIAWKVFSGLVKFGVIALVLLAALYFLSQGGLG